MIVRFNVRYVGRVHGTNARSSPDAAINGTEHRDKLHYLRLMIVLVSIDFDRCSRGIEGGRIHHMGGFPDKWKIEHSKS